MKVKDVIPLGVDAQDVVAHILGLKRLELHFHMEQEIPGNCLERLQQGWPSAYIIGHVDFLGATIKVDPRVLIPRQETEQLAARMGPVKGPLLDLCCGSGAIGIALKKKYEAAEVVLADISQEALTLAAENARLNSVEVKIVESDLLDSLEGTFETIVCNPPYVTEEEWQQMATKDFEPRLALVGGLSFYERLAKDVVRYMRPGGTLFLEVGAGQGAAVKALFDGRPCSLEKDWEGRERFLLVFY